MNSTLTVNQQMNYNNKVTTRAGEAQSSSARTNINNKIINIATVTNESNNDIIINNNNNQTCIDGTYKQIVVMSNYVYINYSEEINMLTKRECKVAKPMCLPIEIQGVDCGLALVDSGATRSLIRKSVLDNIDRLHSTIILKREKVNNMWALSASCHPLPIVESIVVNITSRETLLSRALLYVVDDSTNDFVCDIVLGRSTLASSAYPCLELRGEGSLYHPTTTKSIPCTPGKFITDGDGRRQLVPETYTCDKETLQDSVHTTTINKINNDKISHRQQKKNARNQQAQQRQQQHNEKVKSMSAAVSKSNHLTPVMQEHVLA